ncbi:thioredoxin fold domain-containing protein [Granulosicoccaceae sp. 1_MG-2023]|nr:thioredoxin fold domain-containing protein [Granulosicoccaceae sp. 1_MG-2023]
MIRHLLRLCPAALPVLFGLSLSLGAAVPGEDVLPEPDWFKSSTLDLKADVAAAGNEGKRLLLYFYQDDCPYCRKLVEENLAREDIAAFIRGNFDTVALDINGEREVADLSGLRTTEKQFAKELGVQFTPSLLIIDDEADVALRMNGLYPPESFLRALQWGVDKSAEDAGYTQALSAPADGVEGQAAGDVPGVAEAGIDLSKLVRDPDGHLLVLFEEPACAACDELHQDLFTRPRIKALLDEYHVVVLDATADTPLITPDGEERTAAQWAAELAVAYRPAMLFFDRTSREVFRTDSWLRGFHVEGALAYVAQDAYLETPQFQLYLEYRADAQRARGEEPDLMQ